MNDFLSDLKDALIEQEKISDEKTCENMNFAVKCMQLTRENAELREQNDTLMVLNKGLSTDLSCANFRLTKMREANWIDFRRRMDERI